MALVPASPAPAYLRSFSVSSAGSPSNSISVKSRALQCPSGKLAIGSGGLASPFFEDLGLDRLWVYFAQGAVEDGAVETDGLATSWFARAHALCATPTLVPPRRPGAAGYVKQVTITRIKTPPNSAPVKVLTVACPVGSRSSIGGGGAINSPSPDIAFASMERFAGGTAWRVRAHEVDSTSANWELEAHAVCANITTAPGTASYVAPPASNNAVGIYGPDSATPPSSPAVQSLTVSCPAPPGNPVDTFIIGGAAQVLGPRAGILPPADVVLTQSRPAGTRPVSNGWFAQARETDPTNQHWRLQVKAVCASFSGGPPG
jgi:hypothetical protein